MRVVTGLCLLFASPYCGNAGNSVVDAAPVFCMYIVYASCIFELFVIFYSS